MSRGLTATADAFHFLHTRVSKWETAEDAEFRAAVPAVLEDKRSEFEAEADAIIAYVTSDEFGGNSEYVENLKAIFRGETVSAKNVGLAMSAIGSYNRHLGRIAERAAKAAATPSEHRGAVGDKKHEIVGVVTGHRAIEGNYGTTHLYTFLVGTDVYKWFSSSSQGWKEGDNIHLTGTIKAHDEYNGLKSTVLTRCKAV